MKIAYFTDTFLPQINGVVTSLTTIASALGSSNHKIAIFAPKPKGGRKINWNPKGTSLELLPSMPAFFYPDWRAAAPVSPSLLLRIRKLNPDIIHFQTTFLLGVGGIIFGKVLKRPVVGSFHGYFMEPEYLKIVKLPSQTRMVSKILWKYASFFLNQCDVVLTYSEGAKKDLERHGVKKPIFVIQNAINEKMIKKVDGGKVSEVKKLYKLKKKVVLYVGRISAEKSLDVLIKSFSYAVKEFPDTSLFIIGDGPIRNSIMKLCADLGIEDNVILTGNIPQEQLLTKGYFQTADVFATASTSEVQPVSIIEAMYFGLPLVGVAKRGSLEMIGGIGLISQPDDVKSLAKNIAKVISDKKLHDELSEKSLREYKRKYLLEKVVKSYDLFYKEVLKKYTKRN